MAIPTFTVQDMADAASLHVPLNDALQHSKTHPQKASAESDDAAGLGKQETQPYSEATPVGDLPQEWYKHVPESQRDRVMGRLVRKSVDGEDLFAPEDKCIPVCSCSSTNHVLDLYILKGRVTKLGRSVEWYTHLR